MDMLAPSDVAERPFLANLRRAASKIKFIEIKEKLCGNVGQTERIAALLWVA